MTIFSPPSRGQWYININSGPDRAARRGVQIDPTELGFTCSVSKCAKKFPVPVH